MGTRVFILSGPGGSGKTTLLNKLFRKKIFKKNFIRAISWTTRKRRPKENNGRDYFFVSKEKFLARKKKKFFLESQKVLDNYYGTPKYFYTQAKHAQKNLILCIDVKGGMYLKKHHKVGKITTIFIAAPDSGELYKRLLSRAEKKNIIDERLALAKKEMLAQKDYDYVVINKNIKTAVMDLEDILLARRYE
ncbi:MAG: guanylate kinase [Candidatus Omnitrophica bacterium]|nr:guanylate kinase [Candidatus Omnitrophota bacterium]